MSGEGNVARIQARTGLRPRVGLVLGSGLSGVAAELSDAVTIAYAELGGFPEPGVSGHGGSLVIGSWSGVPVAVLTGRSHYYEHGRADVMRAPLETLAALGVATIVLTNSAGSLRPDVPPGSVMAITDHINFTGRNPLIGEKSDRRFVGMTQAYNAGLLELARKSALDEGLNLAEGVYLWFSGPSFETPAEIRAARILGADAVGMSTVPEVILARFMGLRVLAFSVITNYAAGMTGAELSHEETKEMAPQGGRTLVRLLSRLVGALGP